MNSEPVSARRLMTPENAAMPNSALRIEDIKLRIESFGMRPAAGLEASPGPRFERTSRACRKEVSHSTKQELITANRSHGVREKCPGAESGTAFAGVPPCIGPQWKPWRFHCALSALNNQEIVSGNLRRVR